MAVQMESTDSPADVFTAWLSNLDGMLDVETVNTLMRTSNFVRHAMLTGQKHIGVSAQGSSFPGVLNTLRQELERAAADNCMTQPRIKHASAKEPFLHLAARGCSSPDPLSALLAEAAGKGGQDATGSTAPPKPLTNLGKLVLTQDLSDDAVANRVDAVVARSRQAVRHNPGSVPMPLLLPNLSTIELHECALAPSSLSLLQPLRQVSCLVLSGCTGSFPTSITSLSHLRSLKIDDNGSSGILADGASQHAEQPSLALSSLVGLQGKLTSLTLTGSIHDCWSEAAVQSQLCSTLSALSHLTHLECELSSYFESEEEGTADSIVGWVGGITPITPGLSLLSSLSLPSHHLVRADVAALLRDVPGLRKLTARSIHLGGDDFSSQPPFLLGPPATDRSAVANSSRADTGPVCSWEELTVVEMDAETLSLLPLYSLRTLSLSTLDCRGRMSQMQADSAELVLDAWEHVEEQPLLPSVVEAVRSNLSRLRGGASIAPGLVVDGAARCRDARCLQLHLRVLAAVTVATRTGPAPLLQVGLDRPMLPVLAEATGGGLHTLHLTPPHGRTAEVELRLTFAAADSISASQAPLPAADVPPDSPAVVEAGQEAVQNMLQEGFMAAVGPLPAADDDAQGNAESEALAADSAWSEDEQSGPVTAPSWLPHINQHFSGLMDLALHWQDKLPAQLQDFRGLSVLTALTSLSMTANWQFSRCESSSDAGPADSSKEGASEAEAAEAAASAEGDASGADAEAELPPPAEEVAAHGAVLQAACSLKSLASLHLSLGGYEYAHTEGVVQLAGALTALTSLSLPGHILNEEGARALHRHVPGLKHVHVAAIQLPEPRTPVAPSRGSALNNIAYAAAVVTAARPTGGGAGWERLAVEDPPDVATLAAITPHLSLKQPLTMPTAELAVGFCASPATFRWHADIIAAGSIGKQGIATSGPLSRLSGCDEACDTLEIHTDITGPVPEVVRLSGRLFRPCTNQYAIKICTGMSAGQAEALTACQAADSIRLRDGVGDGVGSSKECVLRLYCMIATEEFWVALAREAGRGCALRGLVLDHDADNGIYVEIKWAALTAFCEHMCLRAPVKQPFTIRGPAILHRHLARVPGLERHEVHIPTRVLRALQQQIEEWGGQVVLDIQCMGQPDLLDSLLLGTEESKATTI
uniref:Uncharacterized protein n=1 Tax=Chlamydomonas leiostraca TaxID=1034604 RepID=A0A7S0X198_9CHLO|mmetsp:Transcript_7594/g.18844  ORF Transcript_7594/g.18844 Transcript_7594/m.18844 type:complete len:1159 (+) Transcript_7594:26-3502(+)|eukprot:CAMPEP_0202862034 /NCGR_PEP_ID=MMETSP1391-20130828/3225_1 /ASSEMBLY_ACC=CAM_ASM_000867 /TAXON_ID=1034604 /ORGANISM="Chlamydomonas leiostraca, Strain SAG 11-49" /LENGTH=1158 /DNA_ID=CAMNT_0049541515 /DNA_START=12 /DNA_END=3488 /DNA_ORIENTATION=-